VVQVATLRLTGQASGRSGQTEKAGDPTSQIFYHT
jgi:hypothetical protein